MAEVDERQGLLRLSAAAAVGGALIGLIGALFRLALTGADRRLAELVAWAHGLSNAGWIVPIAASAAGVALARWLVRFAPVASGSGVQHVEAVMRGEAAPAPLAVVPVKFVGGVLAIGSGLALGREGPTVQMGATIGEELARRLRMGLDDLRNLQAALAGAGLAVAFNAPLGGAVFVFEEISRSFRLRLVAATLIGSCIAIAVSRGILGDEIEFHIGAIRTPPAISLVPYLLFGALMGALGVAYARATIAGLELFARIPIRPVELRAALVGGLVGLVAWFRPELVGGGEALNQGVLAGGSTLSALAVILAVRWVLGPLSYSAGTPGGLFAPLLLVGAAAGALSGEALHAAFPALLVQPEAMAVVGMAALFSAIVRAPITGIALIVEMTGTTTLFVPLLAACFAAVATTTLLGSPPIYDTLRERMLRADVARTPPPPSTSADSRVP